MTAPDRIIAWVKREFNPAHVDRVVQDLIDVATGTREGNRFEREALARIFPELNEPEDPAVDIETPDGTTPRERDIWYRQIHSTSWVAYDGNQAIWEDVSRGLLLGKLKLMGYPEPRWVPLRAVKIT